MLHARVPRRCALHWDNVSEPRELQIRPLGPGWEWSGAFAIPEREEYVGLRIRNRCARRQGGSRASATAARAAAPPIMPPCFRACRQGSGAACVHPAHTAHAARPRLDLYASCSRPSFPSLTMAGVILPVNTTVGRSGVVLITLKSQRSIPPIRWGPLDTRGAHGGHSKRAPQACTFVPAAVPEVATCAERKGAAGAAGSILTRAPRPQDREPLQTRGGAPEAGRLAAAGGGVSARVTQPRPSA